MNQCDRVLINRTIQILKLNNMRRKITIVDCANFDNKINIIIYDDHLTTQESVYCAVELHERLSQRQINKIGEFKRSCEGMYMVCGYLCTSLWQPYESEEWDSGGYVVYYTKDWVQVYVATRVQGDRPRAYRVKREDYKGYESLRESDEMWRGQRIY